MEYSMVAPKTFVLKLTTQCLCQGCQRKLKNLLHKIDGVHSTSIDPNQGMVTITGPVDPQRVINKLEKQYKTAVSLFLEQSPQMDNQHNNNMQITVQPQSQKPAVEEFDDQNLVAQMHRFGGIQGLKHVEVTYSKTTKFTFNDNKDDEHGGGVNNLYSSGNFPPPPELPPPESDYGPSAPPYAYGYPYTFEENPNRCTLFTLLLSLNLGFAIFLFFFFRHF